MFSNTRTTILAWGPTGILAAMALIWFPLSPLRFGSENYAILLKEAIVLSAAYGAGTLVIYRLREDRSRIAKHIRHYSAGLKIFIGALAFLVPLTHFGSLCMYMGASLGQPLLDPALARIDQALGFDWLAFLEATNASPAIAYILVHAYHSTGPQFLLLILFLSLTTWSERLSEFLALLAMTSLITAILFALVPAVGAFDYYRPDRQLFDNFTQNAGMWHYNELIALRSGEEVEFVIGRVEGLVTFPSFHTVLAILTAYAVRDVRLLAAPVAILNAVVIVSTLPEGGHYLIDVLAGIVIAVGAIVLFRIVNAERLGEARAA